MTNITALLGDYYHDAAWIAKSLESSLEMAGIQASIRYLGIEGVREALQDQPDLFICSAENRLDPMAETSPLWMDHELEDSISRYVDEGGSWLALHSGMASYPEDGTYSNMLKGYFKHHPAQQKIRYTIVENGNSELDLSADSFEFLDEHYFVHYDEANTNVFLRSESVDGSSIAGWHHHFGKGRVSCLTPAHNPEGLINSSFVQIFQKLLQWNLDSR